MTEYKDGDLEAALAGENKRKMMALCYEDHFGYPIPMGGATVRLQHPTHSSLYRRLLFESEIVVSNHLTDKGKNLSPDGISVPTLRNGHEVDLMQLSSYYCA